MSAAVLMTAIAIPLLVAAGVGGLLAGRGRRGGAARPGLGPGLGLAPGWLAGFAANAPGWPLVRAVAHHDLAEAVVIATLSGLALNLLPARPWRGRLALMTGGLIAIGGSLGFQPTRWPADDLIPGGIAAALVLVIAPTLGRIEGAGTLRIGIGAGLGLAATALVGHQAVLGALALGLAAASAGSLPWHRIGSRPGQGPPPGPIALAALGVLITALALALVRTGLHPPWTALPLLALPWAGTLGRRLPGLKPRRRREAAHTAGVGLITLASLLAAATMAAARG